MTCSRESATASMVREVAVDVVGKLPAKGRPHRKGETHFIAPIFIKDSGTVDVLSFELTF